MLLTRCSLKLPLFGMCRPEVPLVGPDAVSPQNKLPDLLVNDESAKPDIDLCMTPTSERELRFTPVRQGGVTECIRCDKAAYKSVCASQLSGNSSRSQDALVVIRVYT